MAILEKIRSHEDLVRLNDADRATLCGEIRDFLVSSISKTGGHLASNLGVVELTIALETVFNTQKDRLVFDVGHQSYVHKLLTGRQANFAHLRQFGGMAGFPKPSESDSDAFVAGHASSSVSIALGMARARTMLGESYHVAAVIGDGATTGGMAYEGLNDAGASKEPLLVILNDNEMSIDRNVGGMAHHLNNLRSKAGYVGMKRNVRDFVRKLPGGRYIYKFTSVVKGIIKRVLLDTTVFEDMGFTYLGPVDGHDLPRLLEVLEVAKGLQKPVLLHVVTRKGKGYLPAEQAPSKFHGVGKFDPATGETNPSAKESFSDVFGTEMLRLAEKNPKLCTITAAMPGGTGLLLFKNMYPQRTFDVGIAEEHAVSMAGGLAKQGMVPVVAIYSTFLQRAYDMILQDVAMLGLHVVFAVDRAGLVGEDGETHHGVFDVGFLRQAPGMTVLCPASLAEQTNMLSWAVQQCSGPVAVRYPRGSEGAYTNCAFAPDADLERCGAVCVHRRGADVTLITYGTLINNVLEAADILAERGIFTTVIRLLTVAPLPAQQVLENLSDSRKVVIVEECHAGSGVKEALAWQLPGCQISGVDLGNSYATHGSVAELYRHYGLDARSIADYTEGVVSHEE